ncbi:LPS-assembly protein LptD [Rhodosalinus sp. FB01]|uniref:LPS-assembly protein LptD n=1 Tax=Rhodosalinus sp. FB01 TaxID=3239194 RepID=UPI003523D369
MRAAVWRHARVFLAAAFLAGPAAAQDEPVFLVADRVFLQDNDTLVAEGDVEALQGDVRLSASRLRYDGAAGRLVVEGPIRIEDPESGAVILADAADLDEGLRDGLIAGARLVLDRQLQLASAQLTRVRGRSSMMTRTAVTSCQVCGDEPPLWQIRARRVIHDEKARQIYFDDAQLRVLDVPVLYLPRLRLPDPTLERARGFLFPRVRNTERLGFGLKIPYFIPVGPHQDVTLPPYLSSETRTLELRYRRAFADGDMQIDAAASRDSLGRDGLRGYVIGAGETGLPRGYRLRFAIEAVSDRAYLNDYGYADKDRLRSGLTLSRVRDRDYLEAGFSYYQTLRDGESNSTQPTRTANILYERLMRPAAIGGLARLGLSAHGHFRTSDADVLGRDMARLTAELDWERRWTGPAGLRAGLRAGLAVDHLDVAQDSTGAGADTVVTPALGAELRWPLVRTESGGARQLLEPVAMIAWSGGDRADIAPEESTLPEFDEANLLALSRFPAADRRERGLRGAAGLRWVREDPDGWSAGLVLGRVWRDDPDAAFTAASGLDSGASDWLVAGQLELAEGLSLQARGLFATLGDVNKAEARGTWSTDRLGLGASYLLLPADAAGARPSAISEWSFDADYRLSRHWTGSAEWRYDIAGKRPARAKLGLAYRNACLEVALSASRNYASSASLEPDTDFGLTIALKGYSTGGSAKEYRRRCN